MAQPHLGTISAEVLQEIEAVFSRDKLRILKPLAPYLKTFEGNDYPQLAVDVYGRQSRESADEIVFHISIKATVSPKENLQRGGMRPLVDDSYLGAVIWNHRKQIVRETDISGQQLHTVPPLVLARAMTLAVESDPACLERHVSRSQVV
jgi:hypothetical protein